MARPDRENALVEAGRATRFESGSQAAREAGRKGGTSPKRTWKAEARKMLSLPLTKGKVYGMDDLKRLDQAGEKNLRGMDMILLGMMNQAIQGDNVARDQLFKLVGAYDEAAHEPDESSQAALTDLYRALEGPDNAD